MAVIKKVDYQGTRISSLKRWKDDNPGKKYFDSMLEYEFWLVLKEKDVEFTIPTKPITILPGMDVFDMNKSGRLVRRKQRPTTYLPDFIIEVNGKTIYIDSKGFMRPEARLKYKFFRAMLNKNEYFFVVYSIKGLRRLLEIVETFKNIKSSSTGETLKL